MGLGKKLVSFMLFFYLSCSSFYAVNKDVYAKKILKSTQHVIKKENVLGVPDKKYAELMYKANLDVKFDKHVINREGDDIKVFAKKIRFEYEPNTMGYGVIVKLGGM